MPQCTSGITATQLWTNGSRATLRAAARASSSRATPRDPRLDRHAALDVDGLVGMLHGRPPCLKCSAAPFGTEATALHPTMWGLRDHRPPFRRAGLWTVDRVDAVTDRTARAWTTRSEHAAGRTLPARPRRYAPRDCESNPRLPGQPDTITTPCRQSPCRQCRPVGRFPSGRGLALHVSTGLVHAHDRASAALAVGGGSRLPSSWSPRPLSRRIWSTGRSGGLGPPDEPAAEGVHRDVGWRDFHPVGLSSPYDLEFTQEAHPDPPVFLARASTRASVEAILHGRLVADFAWPSGAVREPPAAPRPRPRTRRR